MLSTLNQRATLAAAWLYGLLSRERGQTLAEYGLILTIIAVGVTVLAMIVFRETLVGAYNSATDCLVGGCT